MRLRIALKHHHRRARPTPVPKSLTRPLAHPRSSQERKARKLRAKEERASKGAVALEEGGTRQCKICGKVRARPPRRRTTPREYGCEPPRRRRRPSRARTNPVADPIVRPSPRPTLLVDAPHRQLRSFAASQGQGGVRGVLRGPRRARGGPDHDATALVKSAKARRAELKELRERKKKQDAETRAAAANAAAATTENIPEVRRDAPSIDDGPSSKRAKPSADDGFVATERFDPAADSDDEDAEREGAEPTNGDADATDPADDTVDDTADAPRRVTDQWSEEKKELRRRQVYVGGVPFYKTEEDIVAAFADEGHAVEAIDCMTFPDSGRFRGIAIITFATREGAKAALAWNGEEWDGTFLTVKKYAPARRRRRRGRGRAPAPATGGGEGGGTAHRVRG